MSKEMNAIELGNIPRAKLKDGDLIVPAEQQAANAELERIGSSARFSKDRAQAALSEFAKDDDLFALPKSDAKSIQDIARANDSTLRMRTTKRENGEIQHTFLLADGIQPLCGNESLWIATITSTATRPTAWAPTRSTVALATTPRPPMARATSGSTPRA
jgi:hypothetical protein